MFRWRPNQLTEPALLGDTESRLAKMRRMCFCVPFSFPSVVDTGGAVTLVVNFYSFGSLNEKLFSTVGLRYANFAHIWERKTTMSRLGVGVPNDPTPWKETEISTATRCDFLWVRWRGRGYVWVEKFCSLERTRRGRLIRVLPSNCRKRTRI